MLLRVTPANRSHAMGSRGVRRRRAARSKTYRRVIDDSTRASPDGGPL